MSKLVVISLGKRDLGTGFPYVTAQLWSDENSKPKKFTGRLTTDREISLLYRRWQRLYEAFYKRLGLRRGSVIEIDEEDTTNFAEDEFSELCQQLQDLINVWLDSDEFRRIDRQLRSQLNPSEEVQVIIETDDDLLQRLPWQHWDFFKDYRQAEIALSPLEYQPPDQDLPKVPRSRIRILAILGNGAGINIQEDRRLLENLPDDAETVFLVEPKRQELDRWLWDEAGWDILFFAGHSRTEEQIGQIDINPNESLTIDQLSNALRRAIERGLQMAIFNSCDGLGLARNLADLHIPQMIVMREPVPDRVAQEFLKNFLRAFSSGKSLYASVREARERLQGWESDFPCASWLPVICQNLAEVPKTWQQLLESKLAHSTMPSHPYQGLFAFREEDAPLFFGRETFTEQLVEAVQNKPLVGVIGSSGSGKSSVVFAGLIPRLRQAKNWKIIKFRTGERPFHALASTIVPILDSQVGRADRILRTRQLALALQQGQWALQDLVEDIVFEAPGIRLLLVIDQFEELYTLCRDVEERQRFLDRLLETVNHASQFTVVFTLRADFYGQVLSSRPFADALQGADIKLGPMNRKELEDAIIKPAEQFGVQIQPGLTVRILDEIKQEPGSLPLLEFALTQLWDKQSNGWLTHAAYNDIGGVKAALARYADEVYEQLSPAEQQRAERVFIQLVRPGEGTEDTRRVATRAEIGEDNWDLAKRLADARLVVTGRIERTVEAGEQTSGEQTSKVEAEETVEVVHEALIREWRRLRDWMDANRDFRTWQDRLKVEIREWEATRRDEGALLRGVSLATAEDWLQKRQAELSPAEQEYIQKSLELRERELAERERELAERERERTERVHEQEREQAERLRLQRLAILRLRGGLAVSLVLAVVAVGLSFVAESRRKQAEISEFKALSTSSEALFIQDQKFDALMESLRAVSRLKQGARANNATRIQVASMLQQAVYGVRERNRIEGHDSPVNSVSFSPDGQMMASASADGTVKLWKRDGDVVTTLGGHSASVRSVSFSPDGKTVATAGDDGTVRLWDLSGKQLTQWTHAEQFSGVGIRIGDKPDGGGKNTLTMIVMDVYANSPAKRAGVKPGDLILAVNGKDATGITAERAKEVIEKEIKGKPGTEVILRISRQGSGELNIPIARDNVKTQVYRVSFSPDGKSLATTGDDAVKLWSLDGKLLQVFGEAKREGHKGKVWDVSFSPDGQLIATASEDGTVKLWKPDGTHIKTLTGFETTVFAVAFSPSGDAIVTADANGDVDLWYRDGKWIKTLGKHTGAAWDVSFSPDGKMIASVSGDSTVKLWSPDVSATNNLIDTLKGHRNIVSAVSFSPDAKTIATASYDKTVRLWSVQSTLITFLESNSDTANDVSFSPDGKSLVSVTGDNKVKLWNRDGTLLGKPWNGQKALWVVSFSPDGQTIASAGYDKAVKVWNLDGSLRTTLEGHSDSVYSVSFSPDGKTIASASKDKTVRLWKSDGTFIKVLEDNSKEENGFLVTSVSFSPDGKMIATASGYTAKLWKSDGTLLTTLKDHRNIVSRVSFSPDSQVIATASADKTVNLWNREGKLLTTLQGHQDWVNDVKFSPDGKIIATAGNDSTVRLWNLDGKLLSTLKGHSNFVNNVSFSPDGKTLASASNDGKIILWDLNLDLDNILVKACHWVGDYLKNNSKVQKSDRNLCDSVERDLVAQGEELAQLGNLESAITMFQKAKEKAKEQNSSLRFDPEKKAKQLAAFALVEKGERLVIQGKVKEAIAAYQEAKQINPELQISATSWNRLCWEGSKHGYPSDVLYACEEAVKLDSENGMIHDSRGLARLLLSNNAGAIEDFQTYIKWWDANKNNESVTDVDKKRMQRLSERRQRWIKELQAGKKFTAGDIQKEMELLWREE